MEGAHKKTFNASNDAHVPIPYTVDVRLKCHFKDEVRVVHSSYAPTFRALCQRLCSDFGFNVSLTYDDDDGDSITLACQNDLDQMYDYCKRANLQKVKLLVKPMKATGSYPGFLPALETENAADSGGGGNMEAENTPNRRIRWRRGELLGEGAFGKVFLALNLDDGNLMAVKQLTIKSQHVESITTLENEINLMKRLVHKHITRYLGTERYQSTLSIFLEYISGGSIAHLLTKFGPFDTAIVRTYTRQILLGLDHLHQNDVAHRDIKGANILVDNAGCVKLSDFGGSINLSDVQNSTNEDGMQSAKGTAYWMAPEVIRQRASKGEWKKADIWSLACTVVEMATGKPPWSNYSNPVTALYQIACRRAAPPMPEEMDDLGCKFLHYCFKPVAADRPSTEELLLHDFVVLDKQPNYKSAVQEQHNSGSGNYGAKSDETRGADAAGGAVGGGGPATGAAAAYDLFGGSSNLGLPAEGRHGWSDGLGAGGVADGGYGGAESFDRPPTKMTLRELEMQESRERRAAGTEADDRSTTPVSESEEGGASDAVGRGGDQTDTDLESEIVNPVDFDPMSLIDHNYSKDISNYGVTTYELQESLAKSGGIRSLADSNFRLNIVTRSRPSGAVKRGRTVQQKEREERKRKGGGGKKMHKLQVEVRKLQDERRRNKQRENILHDSFTLEAGTLEQQQQQGLGPAANLAAGNVGRRNSEQLAPILEPAGYR
jgi:hypothetical protein